PEPVERLTRKRGIFVVSHQARNGRGQVAQARRLTDHSTPRRSAWVDNDERNIHQLAIQATPMKKQAMIAEMLAMIGRNDAQRVVEPPALRKLVQQDSQLFVEVEDRVVVNVDRHSNVSMGQRGFVKLLPRLESRMIRVGDRPESKSRDRSVRRFVRAR